MKAFRAIADKNNQNNCRQLHSSRALPMFSCSWLGFHKLWLAPAQEVPHAPHSRRRTREYPGRARQRVRLGIASSAKQIESQKTNAGPEKWTAKFESKIPMQHPYFNCHAELSRSARPLTTAEPHRRASLAGVLWVGLRDAHAQSSQNRKYSIVKCQGREKCI